MCCKRIFSVASFSKSVARFSCVLHLSQKVFHITEKMSYNQLFAIALDALADISGVAFAVLIDVLRKAVVGDIHQSEPR